MKILVKNYLMKWKGVYNTAMKNDKKIMEKVDELSLVTEEFLCYVNTFNPCAYSDSLVGDIISISKEIEKLHKGNFKQKKGE